MAMRLPFYFRILSLHKSCIKVGKFIYHGLCNVSTNNTCGVYLATHFKRRQLTLLGVAFLCFLQRINEGILNMDKFPTARLDFISDSCLYRRRAILFCSLSGLKGFSELVVYIKMSGITFFNRQ
jgi:hypothetical protein